MNDMLKKIHVVMSVMHTLQNFFHSKSHEQFLCNNNFAHSPRRATHIIYICHMWKQANSHKK